MNAPGLTISGPAADARAVVVFLHGGSETSVAPARRGAAYLRMAPFARAVSWAVRGRDVAVWQLRYRLRGWNGAAEDPVVDARWALGEARRRHPGAPIVLVGHSMGGRVALRLAGEPDVVGVCALAPWITDGEPAPEPGASVLIAHGDDDRVTSPAASAAYAARIGASFVPVPGEKHALLRRPVFWTRLVTAFVTETLAAAAGAR
ncbi:alpha/beta hydrolase [Actinoplanes sp. NBRC 14428]|uniref:Serine aminopeptidase S33 family n=1 Tax=Pseudosporangium ferrugineum TaxID=439699 RepID=A0A2T0RNY0_9ACTN|nr:alpha/beta fold hydrolase [Pseudosporangium ferrugineum]PRY22858.1 serine aminopeptidase S33 family [Pseudosporangium ferrugineum]BCJ55131.1 alpha/beta hydrolase [Actinoplanes sp. NBRC 14428]